MSELTLISDFSLDATSVSSVYIDEYMSANNESQIKIYLFLLRNLSKGAPVSVITIADTFNYSVTDVERALIYMEKQGLMSLRMENDRITGLKLLPLRKIRPESDRTENLYLMETVKSGAADKSAEKMADRSAAKTENRAAGRDAYDMSVPAKPEYSRDEIAEFKAQPDIEELLFVLQTYTGKPLTAADIKSVMYMYRELGFASELIDFLAGYSIGNGKKTFSAMEKTAADWYAGGVKSLDDAKAFTADVPDEVYGVFKAFSVKAGSRRPSASEINYVKKWTKKYAFSMDIVERACQVTIDRTHTVSFEYADAVLTDWHKKDVKHLSDIDALNEKRSKTVSASANDKKSSNSKGAASFNNFAGRDYDFAQLEKELLEN